MVPFTRVCGGGRARPTSRRTLARLCYPPRMALPELAARSRPLPITAMGITCALGVDLQAVEAAWWEGRSGLSPAEDVVADGVWIGRVPGDLPPLPSRLGIFDNRQLRLAGAAWQPLTPAIEAAFSRWGRRRVGVVVGTSTAGIASTERALASKRDAGRWPDGWGFAAQHLLERSADVVRDWIDATGPALTVSTACASSARAFAVARRWIDVGLVDAVLVGGVDSACATTLRGFHGLEVAARGPCLPFAATPTGMTVGEGAAFVLLERERTSARFALLGIGESSDAHHVTAPHPEGRGAAQAIRAAMLDAGVTTSDLDHVNAHGTGTRLNDDAEAKALAAVCPGVPVVASKGATGHTLGAAGAIEVVLTLSTLAKPVLPPRSGDYEARADVALVASHRDGGARNTTRRASVALSSSFAFGGSNVVLVLGQRGAT